MLKRFLERLLGSKPQSNQAPALGIIPGKDGSDCFTRPPQQQTVKAGQVQIQSGRGTNVNLRGLRIQAKGDCSLTIGDGKVVVEADDPIVDGPGAKNVIVLPVKKKKK